MDEPIVYYTDRSKSEREKEVSYTNTSRKMVLMQLSAEQQWRHREQTYEHSGSGGWRQLDVRRE